jgi:hypothetical protein
LCMTRPAGMLFQFHIRRVGSQKRYCSFEPELVLLYCFVP